MNKKTVFVLVFIQLFIMGQVPVQSATGMNVKIENPIQIQDAHSEFKDTIPWGIQRVNAPGAWDVTTGSEEIVVAVLDSGIDLNHPDLKDNLWVNEAEANGEPGVDDDPFLKSYIDDIHGWNFVDNNADIQDDDGHGTHVAGTIAAGLNDYGLVGVAPNVKIMPLRVFNEDGSSISAVYDAIVYAVRRGADIISMSLGTPSNAPALGMEAGADYAEERGVLLVAAAGNDNANLGESPSYPAVLSNVISVAATTENDSRAEFSNYGSANTIAAPGVNINSTYIQGQGASSELLIDGEEQEHFPMLGAAGTDTTGVTAELEYIGLGSASDVEGKDLTGKIALIQRGEYLFADKVANAASAGAEGAIIFNNVDGLFAGTLGGDGDIPAASLSKADGLELLERLENGEAIEANIKILYGLDHTLLQGTSMATPHISGIAALIWSVDPSMTHEEVKGIMIRSAQDLGSPGKDSYFGYGVPDAEVAVNSVSDTTDPEMNFDISVSKASLSPTNRSLLLSGTISATDNNAIYNVGFSYNESRDRLYFNDQVRGDSIEREFSVLLPSNTDSLVLNISATDVRGNTVFQLLDLSQQVRTAKIPTVLIAMGAVLIAVFIVVKKKFLN